MIVNYLLFQCPQTLSTSRNDGFFQILEFIFAPFKLSTT
ncbi:hypothetical protein THTE_2682 [Thermogutta terrifontis]|uniref:Uncharacterized protein n=1 Tax=Thermogutta terrifontis TaxID=1331910 RepID=A0A286RH34_9BACT|nr:hypothetical protein THTE_2682 [Thermogutta terrifontis]